MKNFSLDKNDFNIKDLATIVKKDTNTIRSWEYKGIIIKPENKTENGWRQYNKEQLANTLETLLNYNWQRKVIKNESEIQHAIDYLRGKTNDSIFSLIGDNNG